MCDRRSSDIRRDRGLTPRLGVCYRDNHGNRDRQEFLAVSPWWHHQHYSAYSETQLQGEDTCSSLLKTVPGPLIYLPWNMLVEVTIYPLPKHSASHTPRSGQQ